MQAIQSIVRNVGVSKAPMANVQSSLVLPPVVDARVLDRVEEGALLDWVDQQVRHYTARRLEGQMLVACTGTCTCVYTGIAIQTNKETGTNTPEYMHYLNVATVRNV